MTTDGRTGEKPNGERGIENELGQAVSGDPWENVGRVALSYQLEQFGSEVQTAFREVDGKVRNGEELTRADLQKMSHALEMARYTLEMVEELVPPAAAVDEGTGNDPRPA